MFKVEWHRKAKKELAKIPKESARQLYLRSKELESNPVENSFPLSGCDYRKIRSGDYRAIIDVLWDSKLVRILMVGHRKNIYKKFLGKL